MEKHEVDLGPKMTTHINNFVKQNYVKFSTLEQSLRDGALRQYLLSARIPTVCWSLCNTPKFCLIVPEL